jgi:hypothetical protein
MQPQSFIFLSFTGFWFLKAWAGAQTSEWHQQHKEEATMKTLYKAPPLPPSKDRIFLEWHQNHMFLQHNNLHCHYSIFFNDPLPPLHPFVTRVLISKSHALQCAAFQLVTHHAFHANYSSSFCLMAGNNTSCPYGGSSWTMPHVLFNCNKFWEPCSLILDPIYHNTIHQLFSSRDGSCCLVKFLHVTQALLCPLPPCPTDPPWIKTW